MAINKTINKRTNSHGAMRNCIEYVLREGKTDQHLVHIIGPYPYEEVNYDLVYQSFLEEKRLWGKDSGRMYAHNVISWHKDEKITPEQALEFGIAFAEKWFSGFQTVVSVHKDKDHIHCHLVTNSVSYENGKKLHNSRKDLERMKQLTNQMCRERGLTVAGKGKHFDGSQIETGEVIAWSKDKYNLFRQQKKDSFVADCAMVVLTVMESCISREQFIKEMGNLGWNVNWTENRKHITFQNSEGKKVRDSNLSKTFHLKISKGELEDEFIRNEQKERCITVRDDTADADLARYYRQVEALSKVKTERDRLLEIQRKDQENIQKCLERMRELRENLQKISSENQKLQDELQKLTEENQKLQTELSRTQNINLSLQRSNDDLRNRNGLLSRKEQEQLEEKIRDVQDRNSKLEKMVVQSSVEAVEEALKKQQEAEKRMCSLELLMKMERRDAACQLEKTKRQMKKKTMEIEKQRDFGWLGLLICCLLFIIFVFIW